eukprot:SAG25_NODE_1245_length_3510_cov_1468.316431_9_plen_31_part_00
MVHLVLGRSAMSILAPEVDCAAHGNHSGGA